MLKEFTIRANKNKLRMRIVFAMVFFATSTSHGNWAAEFLGLNNLPGGGILQILKPSTSARPRVPEPPVTQMDGSESPSEGAKDTAFTFSDAAGGGPLKRQQIRDADLKSGFFQYSEKTISLLRDLREKFQNIERLFKSNPLSSSGGFYDLTRADVEFTNKHFKIAVRDVQIIFDELMRGETKKIAELKLEPEDILILLSLKDISSNVMLTQEFGNAIRKLIELNRDDGLDENEPHNKMLALLVGYEVIRSNFDKKGNSNSEILAVLNVFFSSLFTSELSKVFIEAHKLSTQTNQIKLIDEVTKKLSTIQLSGNREQRRAQVYEALKTDNNLVSIEKLENMILAYSTIVSGNNTDVIEDMDKHMSAWVRALFTRVLGKVAAENERLSQQAQDANERQTLQAQDTIEALQNLREARYEEQKIKDTFFNTAPGIIFSSLPAAIAANFLMFDFLGVMGGMSSNFVYFYQEMYYGQPLYELVPGFGIPAALMGFAMVLYKNMTKQKRNERIYEETDFSEDEQNQLDRAKSDLKLQNDTRERMNLFDIRILGDFSMGHLCGKSLGASR